MNHAAPSEDADAFDADDSTGDEAIDRDFEREIAELNDKYLRALADYQNFRRRSIENEQRERVAGVAALGRLLVPVLDQFELALSASGDAERLRDGMKLIRTELLKALLAAGVEPVEPSVGDEFDPNQHEAVMRQPAEGVGPDAISAVLQPGYRLGEMVLRPAKVALAPEPND